MRRLLRWAFNFSAATSAVLFVALGSAAIAVRYGRTAWFTRRASDEETKVRLSDGWLWLQRYDMRPDGQGRRGMTYQQQGGGSSRDWFLLVDCHRETTYPSLGRSIRFIESSVEIPLGRDLFILVLLPAIRGLVSLRRHLKKRVNDAAGKCPACGYDLRATPEL